MKQQITSTNAAMAKNSIILICAMCLFASTVLVRKVDAMNMADQLESSSGKPSVTLAVIESPEVVTRVLESLLRSILYSASLDLQAQPQSGMVAQKRGLDLGISRGFSGSQAGKHLMGLSAASFANGPGRR